VLLKELFDFIDHDCRERALILRPRSPVIARSGCQKLKLPLARLFRIKSHASVAAVKDNEDVAVDDPQSRKHIIEVYFWVAVAVAFVFTSVH
jgi:hypothetical protein